MKRLFAILLSLVAVAAACTSTTDTAAPAADSDAAPTAEDASAPTTESAGPLPGVLNDVVLDGYESDVVSTDGIVLEPIGGDVSVSTDESDPVIGAKAPSVTGTSFDGSEVVISDDGRAKVVYFVAHWCPHCQDEVTAIARAINAGELPDNVDVYLVSTGIRDGAPNYPPSEWIKGASWPAPVLRDDPGSTLALAYGLGGFPYAVYLDSSHSVVARSQGELAASDTLALWELASQG